MQMKLMAIAAMLLEGWLDPSKCKTVLLSWASPHTPNQQGWSLELTTLNGDPELSFYPFIKGKLPQTPGE